VSVALPPGYSLQSISRNHSRRVFDCGHSQVNQWSQSNALQHQEKCLSATKTVIDGDGAIAGFYTLATGQVDFGDLPTDISRKLPRRALPVAILAWLGVNLTHQRRNLGEILVAQALRDCYEAGKTFAFVAIIIDCIDDRAKSFYKRWDFLELPGNPYRLFLPAKTLTSMMTTGTK